MQETLLGVLGFDDLDFVQELLTHRNEIIEAIVCPFAILFNGRIWRTNPILFT